MKTQSLSIISTLCAALISATAEKCDRPPEAGILCTHLVFAKDMSGLDGCEMLLMKADSTLLLPTNLEEYAPELMDGSAAMAGYEVQEDMVSICMAEKAIVKLTCFQKLPGVAECPEMTDPYRQDWSEKVMQNTDARKVELIYIGELPAYRFSSARETGIYACNGALLCSMQNNAPGTCASLLDQIRVARVVYVVNE